MADKPPPQATGPEPVLMVATLPQPGSRFKSKSGGTDMQATAARRATVTPGRARPKSKRAEAGTDITLAALMRLYGMAPRPTADGSWSAKHPTARRREAVVHIDATLSRWWFKHPFVEKTREGDLFSFIAWMEGCGLYGIAHMLRDEYPRLLAEAGIPENYGLDTAERKEG